VAAPLKLCIVWIKVAGLMELPQTHRTQRGVINKGAAKRPLPGWIKQLGREIALALAWCQRWYSDAHQWEKIQFEQPISQFFK